MEQKASGNCLNRTRKGLNEKGLTSFTYQVQINGGDKKNFAFLNAKGVNFSSW